VSRPRLRVLAAPPGGVWRVGWGDAPLAASRLPPELLAETTAGNRFDSPSGAYGVIYCAARLTACFGETLARHRPHPTLAALVAEEWERLGFMEIGAVAAEWRQRRVAVRVRLQGRFLDVESPTTRARLRLELGAALADLGYDDFDVPAVRGHDRRLTRLMSQWAHDQPGRQGSPRFAGIRYLSRLDSRWECLAIFDETPLEIVESHAITPDMPELQDIARRYGLRIH
jgi:hypothetical protein